MATPRLAIPEISESQSSKYITHNHALELVDLYASGLVLSRASSAAEPGSPAEGDAHLLEGTPTGTNWAGNGSTIAHYYGGAWQFYSYTEGLQFYVADEDIIVGYNGSAWVQVGTVEDPVALAIALG